MGVSEERTAAKDSGRERSLYSGVAFSVAGAFFFGTLAIFAKYAYRAGADPFPLLALRFATAGVLMLVFHAAIGRPVGVPRRMLLRLLALGAIGYGIESSLFFIALRHAPAAVVGLVFYSYPIWTTLGAIALGMERFSAAIAAALGLACGGIVLIFSLPEGGLAGPLYALASSIAVTGYFLAAQVLLRDVTASVAALWTSVGAVAFTGGASLATWTWLPSEAIWPALALGGVTAAAFLLMYEAIARIGSSRYAIAATLEPVTTLVLAALLLSEEVTARIALGGAMVIAALPVLLRTEERPVPAADSS